MRILIIEDDLDISAFLKSGLESQLFVVDCAPDGQLGAFWARTNPYQLIVLDCNLPKLKGYQVLQEIRQEKCQTPVLVLSVKGALEDKKEMFNLGADDYLVKPFVFEEFMLRVKALLNRPLKTKANLIKLGEISLNQQTKIVKRKNEKIILTKKEYNLLEFFLNRKGEVLSRVEIMENVWDVNADPFSNSIEAHIMNLRKKINKNGAKNYLHTLAGRGYKFDLEKN